MGQGPQHDRVAGAGRRFRLLVASEADLVSFARRLADRLAPGDVLGLSGPLGAGKTALARALIQALAPEGPPPEVPSPTFALVQGYETRLGPLVHADLFRLERESELAELGLKEALGEAILLIEWPERAEGLLPPDRLEIALAFAPAPEARGLTLTPHGAWRERLGHGA